MPQDRRVFVIATFREFDEAAWRRLLVAYAYALHDQRQAEKKQKEEQAQAEAARQEGTA